MEKALKKKDDIYGGRPPSELPAYSIAEAAACLGLPTSTVRDWVLGRKYKTVSGTTTAKAVIRIADGRSRYLSFVNLVEVHVLAAIRRGHRVKLPAVRRALGYLERALGTKRPLAEVQMLTDGKDLFVETYGRLIDASQEGQLAMKEVLELHLHRIERDAAGLPIRLFPFTKNDERDERVISIDPRLQFGRPCVAGTRIPTREIAERCKAGEAIRAIADDFGITGDQVEAAIRYELRAAA